MNQAFIPALVGIVILGSVAPVGADPAVTSSPLASTQTLISAQARTGKVDLSIELEGRAAVNRALDWMAAQQQPSGCWSDTNFPALTALPLWSFALSDHKDRAAVTEKAAAFIVSCVQPDGGIYRRLPGKGGGLANYNTALCMVALHALNPAKYAKIVLDARAFLAAGQHFGGDVYEGGMGYDRDTGRAYADLSSSVFAYEAMRLTQGTEDLRPTGDKRVDLDWEAARRFLSRLQLTNAADTNAAGGFIYRPDESKAGAQTNAQGQVVFRAYGSMTYAGLLSLLYADVDRNDGRVKSAFDWSVRHWSLNENPGMGTEGLYYFYNVLSKSLAAFGREEIPTQTAGAVFWREQLVKRLVSLQKTDTATGYGYWVNDNNRFWESNPLLVTAYGTLALQVAMGK